MDSCLGNKCFLLIIDFFSRYYIFLIVCLKYHIGRLGHRGGLTKKITSNKTFLYTSYMLKYKVFINTLLITESL